mmetsp:Transcript_7624/g.18408  ORF Transcript_7624/g.18408 Transcript_7624/m.18408 type:complete len:281 (-) Transcript_7624:770-1612(-)
MAIVEHPQHAGAGRELGGRGAYEEFPGGCVREHLQCGMVGTVLWEQPRLTLLPISPGRCTRLPLRRRAHFDDGDRVVVLAAFRGRGPHASQVDLPNERQPAPEHHERPARCEHPLSDVCETPLHPRWEYAAARRGAALVPEEKDVHCFRDAERKEGCACCQTVGLALQNERLSEERPGDAPQHRLFPVNQERLLRAQRPHLRRNSALRLQPRHRHLGRGRAAHRPRPLLLGPLLIILPRGRGTSPPRGARNAVERPGEDGVSGVGHAGWGFDVETAWVSV